jgi:hypothetical protein
MEEWQPDMAQLEVSILSWMTSKVDPVGTGSVPGLSDDLVQATMTWAAKSTVRVMIDIFRMRFPVWG